ncbi:MAG: creatininase family protein [Oscillospiraceae bacterium]|jgi:creatinine amidohydrolase|nr:creatininase family protein [Oscillospiraceae bacterium]
MTEKTLYQELRPEELIERVNTCPIAYLPLGTLEWHSFHLPFGVDMLVPLEIFKRIAARVGGVVLPPLFLGPDKEETRDGKTYYGMDVLAFEEGHPQQLTGSAYHVSKELYIQILENIVKHLKRNGFAALIGHGHGPSSNVLMECRERFAEEYGMVITNLYEIGYEIQTDHAAVNETSLMMELYGGLVDLSRIPEGSPPVAVWGADPRAAASKAEGARCAARNGEMAERFLMELRERLPKPDLRLDFRHIKDLTKGDA